MLSLDKFKKVAQDQDTVTMRHEDGHEMKIMLKGIGSAIQREQLKRLKMADGGLLETAKSLSRKGDKSEKGVHQPVKPGSGKSAAGESSQWGAPGSAAREQIGVSGAKREHKRVLEEIKSNPKPHGNYAKGGQIQHFDDGTGKDGVQAQDPTSDQNSSSETPVEQNATPAQQPAPGGQTVIVNAAPAQPAQPQDMKPVSVPVSVPEVSQAPVNAAQNTAGTQGAALTQSRAAQLNEQARNQEQQVAAARAQAQVPVEQLKQQQAQAAAQRADLAFQRVNTATENLKQYIDQNPINRNKIFQEMGDGQKVATALGLFLGGAKQGLVGGSNPALDWLQDQQQKDVNAQIQNAQNQRTLWGAYNDLFHNENAATEMVKKSWNDQVSAISNEITAKLGTPQSAVNNKLLQAEYLNKNGDSLRKASFFTEVPSGGGAAVPAQQETGPAGKKRSIEGIGASEAPKYGPQNADERGIYNIQPLVAQDANTKLGRLQQKSDGGDPKAMADLQRVQEELADASQRDVMIKQMPRLMQTLLENRTPGGWFGRNIEGSAVGAASIPVLGPAIGTAVGALSNYAGEGVNMFAPGKSDKNSSFRMEENYNTARNQIADYISKLYPTSSAAERASKLNGVIADLNSNPENVKAHMKSFEDLAKSGGKYNALKRWGMLNEGTLD